MNPHPDAEPRAFEFQVILSKTVPVYDPTKQTGAKQLHPAYSDALALASPTDDDNAAFFPEAADPVAQSSPWCAQRSSPSLETFLDDGLVLDSEAKAGNADPPEALTAFIDEGLFLGSAAAADNAGPPEGPATCPNHPPGQPPRYPCKKTISFYESFGLGVPEADNVNPLEATATCPTLPPRHPNELDPSLYESFGLGVPEADNVNPLKATATCPTLPPRHPNELDPSLYESFGLSQTTYKLSPTTNDLGLTEARGSSMFSSRNWATSMSQSTHSQRSMYTSSVDAMYDISCYTDGKTHLSTHL
eukprot:gene32514-17221_t